MIINLTNVFNRENECLKLDTTVSPNERGLISDYELSEPIKLRGTVFNRAGVVHIEAQADYTICAPCDRCADPVERPMHTAIAHVIVNSLAGSDNDELLLVPDMLLDLDELVYTDVLLDLPTKLLCKENCRGLCMSCGKNLNHESCSCERPIDPRLAVLKELLDN